MTSPLLESRAAQRATWSRTARGCRGGRATPTRVWPTCTVSSRWCRATKGRRRTAAVRHLHEAPAAQSTGSLCLVGLRHRLSDRRKGKYGRRSVNCKREGTSTGLGAATTTPHPANLSNGADLPRVGGHDADQVRGLRGDRDGAEAGGGSMPMTPPRRCPSCRQLVTARRCPTCTSAADRTRGNAAARGYCSARWRKVRAQKLSADPLCSTCLRAGRMPTATDVDHLERVAGPQDPRFFVWEILDSKCKSCHSRKTALEDSTFVTRGLNATGTSTSRNRLAGRFSRVQNPEGPSLA